MRRWRGGFTRYRACRRPIWEANRIHVKPRNFGWLAGWLAGRLICALGGFFARVLRVLEALGGSFVRISRVQEAPGGSRFELRSRVGPLPKNLRLEASEAS